MLMVEQVLFLRATLMQSEANYFWVRENGFPLFK